MCDEVIGELAVTNEEDFQKLLRPMNGYTLDEYVNNMIQFKKWYRGVFILDNTFLKNYSDSEESLKYFAKVLDMIKPDRFYFQTNNNERLKGAFQITDEHLKKIQERFKDSK